MDEFCAEVGVAVGMSASEVAKSMSLLEAHHMLRRHRKHTQHVLATLGALIAQGSAAGFGQKGAHEALTQTLRKLRA